MMTRTSGSSLVKWPVWLLFACVAVSLVRSGDAAAQVVATKPQLAKNQAGFYRLKVGRVEVTALSDGTMTWDALGQLTNISPAAARRLLDASFLKSPIVGAVNAYLIQLRGRLLWSMRARATRWGRYCSNFLTVSRPSATPLTRSRTFW